MAAAAIAPAPEQPGPEPTREQIEALAYKLWEERGRPAGNGELDWLEAERRLRAKVGNPPAPPAENGQGLGGRRFRPRFLPFHYSRRMIFLLQQRRSPVSQPRRAWRPLRLMPLM